MALDTTLGVRLAALLILHTRFEPAEILKDLAAKKVTVFPGGPTMYTAINHSPGVEAHDLRSLKFCGSGSAALPREVQQRFMELTGCSLVEGWGMTERVRCVCQVPT